jgi:hypothetical protein
MTRIVWNQTTASGRRTSWAKPFDTIALGHGAAQGAKAFYLSSDPLRPGGYLENGVETDLPEGTLVLEVRPEGSVKNGSQQARVYEVVSDNGSGELALRLGGWDWRKQYLSLVDECQKALGRRALADDSDSNPLAEYTTGQLLAELERRGMARVD